MQGDAERSPSAERMARLRKRRRQGLRAIRIDVRHTEIDAMVARGLLSPEKRDDGAAISNALGRLLDQVFRRAPGPS